jgi:indolepyruvate ferredoxin oxidoreductase
MMKAFRVLAKMKGLRGTALDVFGRTAERKMERQLLADYEKNIDEILAKLGTGNHALAVAIASLPEHVRGYGHVKDAFVAEVKAEEAKLLQQWRSPTIPIAAASKEKVAA